MVFIVVKVVLEKFKFLFFTESKICEYFTPGAPHNTLSLEYRAMRPSVLTVIDFLDYVKQFQSYNEERLYWFLEFVNCTIWINSKILNMQSKTKNFFGKN